jgi:hypothetical protein
MGNQIWGTEWLEEVSNPWVASGNGRPDRKRGDIDDYL